MFKSEYIFAQILLPFSIGIGIFYFFASPLSINILTIAAITILAVLITINIFYVRLNIYQFKGLIGLLIFLFFFIIGGLLCLFNNEKIRPDYFDKAKFTYLKVYVNDEPQQVNKILKFKARVISGYNDGVRINLKGQLLITLQPDSLSSVKLKYGDELIISTKYEELDPPYNPGEFDFKAWLAGQNIYHQTFIMQNQFVKTNRNVGNPIIKLAIDLREKQVAKYRKLIKSENAFAFASTLILGYRTDLSQETLAIYSKTGTIHALSVSGAHVAIIYVVLDFLLFFLDRRKRLKVIKLILICGLIWFYALITGLSPSVVRAAIMITIFITAKTFSKNKNGYNILAFSAFCQLIYDPFLIWDVGFQLSYLAVFGLVYLQPKIYNIFYLKNKWLAKLWNLTALSLAAQIITFPLSIYYFHQFPIYFLLGNLFITLPLVLMMYLGILILIPKLSFLAPIFERIINFTNDVLSRIANLPFSTVSSIWINLPEFILLSLATGLFVYAIANFNKKILLLSLLVFVTYQLLVIKDDLQAINRRQIIFFTLRKNYAAAFVTGRHTILLTDLNIEDRNFKFYVKPALEQKQLNKIIFISFKKDTVLGDFIKKDRQIVFNKYKILLIDESLNYKNMELSGNFSAIWLHNNTKFDLEKLKPELKYKSILIDASNKDYKIKDYIRFAEKTKSESHVFKKNKAYLIDLNH